MVSLSNVEASRSRAHFRVVPPVSAPSAPLPHVSDGLSSSLTRFLPIFSGFFVSSLAALYSTTLRNLLLLWNAWNLSGY